MSDLTEGGCWTPSEMTTSCGSIFYVSGCVKNKTVYFWICLLGSLDRAKSYSCTLSITNKTGEKFFYSGPVNTLDKGKNDIITSGSSFSVGIDAVNRSLNEKNEVGMKIIIKNKSLQMPKTYITWV